jgi:hypothetical protein
MRFKRNSIGCFHVKPAEVRTAEGKRILLAVIDRKLTFAHLRLEKKAGEVEGKRLA